MTAPNPLSEQDLEAARAELSGGKPVTVWFTSAAVGVPVNGSAKVISIDDPAEGDFIQVRPAGSRDTMFCSPGELTRTRPARKRVTPQAERAPEPVVSPKAAPPKTAPPKTAPPKSEPPRASREPAPQPPAASPESVPDRPRPAASRPAARPAEVTVTLSATIDGEWTVEVMIGKKRTMRPTPVSAGDVAKAARSLPDVVTQAIESSLEAARRRQLERVERLSAELDAAQRVLQELSG